MYLSKDFPFARVSGFLVDGMRVKEMGRNYTTNPNDYRLLEEVGYGASATVYRAIFLPTNDVVAVKCLDLDRCNSNLVCSILAFLWCFCDLVCLFVFLILVGVSFLLIWLECGFL